MIIGYQDWVTMTPFTLRNGRLRGLPALPTTACR